MTATEILAAKAPAQLFPGNDASAKARFRELAKEWHPDVNKAPQAVAVFQQINALYAKRKRSGTITIGTVDFSFFVRRRFEIGESFVTQNEVVYVFDTDRKSLYENALVRMNSYRFGSDRMKKEVERYLPVSGIGFATDKNRTAFRVGRPHGLIALADVIDYAGPIDPRSIAWIVSSLLNLCCYFDWAKLTHNDISLYTYFIDPANHSGALLGGWSYAVPDGEKLTYVPRRTHDVLPWDVRKGGVASTRTDLELVKATAREMLKGQTVGGDLTRWANTICTRSAVDEYGVWQEVLTKTFGPRRFHQWDLAAEHVYGG